MGIAKPVFSVIIPTYKRKKSLNKCLEAILQLSYPKDSFEVIIVDDSDDHGIGQSLLLFQDHLKLTVLSQKNAGPASARNKGSCHAAGQYLVFIDDDCAPEPIWLNAIEQRLLKTPGCAIAGRMINALNNNPYSNASQIIIDYLFEYYNADPSQSHFAVSGNAVFPTESFKIIGGFDENFKHPGGEDRDLCLRWVGHGFCLLYDPKVVVKHYHVLSLRTYLKQHCEYGRGAYLFHKKVKRHDTKKKKHEPLKFYIRLLTYPFHRSVSTNKAILLTLLFLSQISILAGYFMERVQQSIIRKT